MNVNFVMLVIATVCWFIAAIGLTWSIQVGWLGLFFYGLSLIISNVPKRP